jgi:predicted nucleic acid-binding protein
MAPYPAIPGGAVIRHSGARPVVDASVAAKWVLKEEFADRAQLLADRAAGAGRLIAPSVLPNEIVNAVFQNHRRGRLTSEESDILVADALRLIDLRVELLPLPFSLVAEAYAFAKTHTLPAIYDSL